MSYDQRIILHEFGFVICSQNEELKQNTEKWIKKHFPEDTKICFFENSESIFKAYNEGIEKTSNCQFVCLCHEDIDVENINLDTIRKKLSDPNAGFLGVAGAKKLDESGCWWKDYEGRPHKNLSGQAGHQKKLEDGRIQRWRNLYGAIGPVQVLDGVFLICRRDLLSNIQFDDKTFDGFDFYDISITYEAWKKGYKNYTISGIDLYHWGLGNPRNTWEENRKKFLIWKDKL